MDWAEFGQMMVIIIGAITTSALAIIPKYYREKSRALKAEAERDALKDGVREVNDPITRAAIKKTTMMRGIENLFESNDDCA